MFLHLLRFRTTTTTIAALLYSALQSYSVYYETNNKMAKENFQQHRPIALAWTANNNLTHGTLYHSEHT